MENLIEVTELRKQFGNLVAVDGVSLAVKRGDVLGFLGPNGAGKSTTMKMITGFLAPTSGAIKIAGRALSDDPIAAKTRIGYLPEGAPAYGEMTPIAFLDFVADIRGLKSAVKVTRIRDVIAKIHLEGVLTQTIETLSKGYKRRVGLAQAILHDPEILIMDEPTDGLDPNQKHEVRTLIKEMAPTKAIIISTHILEEVDAVCTRTAIIAKGRLVFSGTPGELEARSRYHNAVTLTIESTRATAIESALRDLDNVAAVEQTPRSNSVVRITALPRTGKSIFGEIQVLSQRQGWAVAEMFIEGGHLDEVFRTITTNTGSRSAGEKP